MSALWNQLAGETLGETLRETLGETLNALMAARPPGARLYALIDAAHAPVGAAALQRHVMPGSAIGLFEGMPEASAQSAGPYLLPLNPDEDTHQARLAWLLAAEREAPCVSWLWTQATPQALARHLQQQLIATLPDGAQALLRFYDPRVLQQLFSARLLDAAQQRALLGAIERWQWYLAGHGAQVYDAHAAHSMRLPKEPHDYV